MNAVLSSLIGLSRALRECSCVRHHQQPKWTGMRPMIGIDRTDLYHLGGCSMSRSHRGVVAAAAGSAPTLCLSVGLTAGAFAMLILLTRVEA